MSCGSSDVSSEVCCRGGDQLALSQWYLSWTREEVDERLHSRDSKRLRVRFGLIDTVTDRKDRCRDRVLLTRTVVWDFVTSRHSDMVTQ